MQNPVQLVIADDHPGVVAAVRRLVSGVDGFEVVGEASNADELLAVLGRVRCDLVITDYAMPGSRYGDGILLLEFLVRRHPDLRVMVLTMLETRALMSNILRAGIKVIVSKSDEPQHILEGMHAAAGGRIYLSPMLNAKLLCRNGEPQAVHDDPVAKLGKRELEVLRMYVTGKTVSEIALQLNRSVKTISSQKQTAMRKLELGTEAALFDFAVRHGLLGSSEA
ncbi:response regulator [Ralstonia sp. 22086]|jgi:two-component system capsular synthesis response regulator RcsB|uniref:Transcriptional regulatory protein RcsB n=2 Tax=Ralstonia TaxID=48736 RepID=A0AAD2B418_9RALS|nr:response regulator transcription factor [Ralstonia wenshanensis]MCT7308536.1 response regulator transcription factor [Ralstonia wenshanensis]MDY7510748.1 response regulator transcription factor [Ralstonia wenshanensis]UGS90637.1 response regulator transcription factor [Ralstonia wenshanensis]CAJ0701168.1 Transcriptional regulatory protein RcsB [Ralstonia wenshanensis]CAJ0819243.1 Transcriptional regulatory protein RcsB [Ralstonia wenshanensis]